MKQNLWTVKDVSLFTGLNRKKINDYSDVIKAKKQANAGYVDRNGTSYTGYKLYDDEALHQFILVSLLSGLQLDRKEIKKAIKKEQDEQFVLNLVIKTAEEQLQKYNDVLTMAKFFKQIGLKNANGFFNVANLHDSAEYVRKINDPAYYEEIFQGIEDWDDEQRDEFKILFMSFEDYGENPKSEEAKKYFKYVLESLEKKGIHISKKNGFAMMFTLQESNIFQEKFSELIGEEACRVMGETGYSFYISEIEDELDQLLSVERIAILKEGSSNDIGMLVEDLHEMCTRYIDIISDRMFYALVYFSIQGIERQRENIGKESETKDLQDWFRCLYMLPEAIKKHYNIEL